MECVCVCFSTTVCKMSDRNGFWVERRATADYLDQVYSVSWKIQFWSEAEEDKVNLYLPARD